MSIKAFWNSATPQVSGEPQFKTSAESGPLETKLSIIDNQTDLLTYGTADQVVWRPANIRRV